MFQGWRRPPPVLIPEPRLNAAIVTEETAPRFDALHYRFALGYDRLRGTCGNPIVTLNAICV